MDPIALFLVVFLAAGLAMLFWMDTIEVSLTTAELAGKLMEKPRPERGDSLMDKPCPECGGSGTVTGDWEPDWMISLSGCGGGEGGSYRTETCGSCAGTGRESSG